MQDSAGSRPTYSLRALSRMLEYARAAAPTYGLQRALYDGGAMAFLTQLDAASAVVLERLLQTHLLGATRPSEVKVTHIVAARKNCRTLWKLPNFGADI